MRFICAILLFFSLTEAFAQKNTIIYGKGTYFFSLGLQSSSYSKSDILFRNSGQEVTLSGINGLSTPNKMIATSFLEQALRSTTVSVGYYMRKNISVSLGLMNHNYVLQYKNTQLKNALILNSFSLSSYPDSVLNDDATFFYQNNINILTESQLPFNNNIRPNELTNNICNSNYCEVKINDSNGIGQGRIYDR